MPYLSQWISQFLTSESPWHWRCSLPVLITCEYAGASDDDIMHRECMSGDGIHNDTICNDSTHDNKIYSADSHEMYSKVDFYLVLALARLCV